MRAIFTALYTLIALGALTSVSFAQCSEISQPPSAQKVVTVLRGYEPVKIVFSADAGDASEKAESIKDVTFRFWIEGHVRVLFDRDGYMKQVHQCTFGPRDRSVRRTLKTYVNIWYRRLSGTDIVRGESMMLIPKSVAATQPRVGITLDSGTEMQGTWRREKGARRSYLVLSIAPVS